MLMEKGSSIYEGWSGVHSEGKWTQPTYDVNARYFEILLLRTAKLILHGNEQLAIQNITLEDLARKFFMTVYTIEV